MNLYGAPYPIVKHPRGFLHTQSGIDQVKSDLIVLLLTNPGERPMLPEYGTPLKTLMFEPNDSIIIQQAKDMIAASIRMWEPRVTISDITITAGLPDDDLNPQDTLDEKEHILGIVISFFDPNKINEVQQLKLEVPL